MAPTPPPPPPHEEEPSPKRVRFAASMSANEATRLSIATSGAQVEAGALQQFAPKFTYHAFGTDETVEGYEGLRVSVCFNAFDFRAWLDVRFEEKQSGADDIVSKLAPSLPPSFTQDREQFVRELNELEAQFTGPPGECVSTYTIGHGGEGSAARTFELYECKLEDNERAQKLHTNLQTAALWFIEGADAVDVSDPRWVVYLAYERPDAGGFALAGFVTVFKFFNPLGRKAPYCKPGQHETRRICQALIFPLYQRQGHCERLVRHIFADAVANPQVYEVTVEDPVPAFSSLRDLVDVKNCAARGFFSLAPHDSPGSSPAFGTSELRLSDIHAVQEALKITQRQVQTCYEALKLRFVDRSDAAVLKKFRLEVKKRLHKMHAEELDGMGSAERRKAFLEAEYQALEAHYARLLTRL